ncbi:MAG TPA: S1C family serine protease [Actinomycetota bacterium]|nr:S1C family serine protease [Actinomycetota bacterium]
MGVLQELEEAVGSVATKAGPSVVGIGGGWGHGSGVVIVEGNVLTNAHNVRGDQVTVVFADGRSATGEVTGTDLDGDLAVVSVDTTGAPAIEWEPAAGAPSVGTAVFALSNRGGRGLRVTFGQVSSVGRGFRGPRGRRIAGSIEHTAPMAQGSSGGPVVDATGRFVALNTNRAGEGFYLALPADAELRQRVEALSKGESPFRPHLGIGIIPGRMARRLRRAVGLPDRDGLLVRVVEEGSPAAAAGLEQGDYIVTAAGTDVPSVEALYKAMEGLQPGATLELTLLRGTEERTVTLTLAT